MKRKTLTATAAAAAIALAAAAYAAPALAHGPQGVPYGGPAWQGQGGYGMMGHMGHMGPGMMGPGMGSGMMGYGAGPGMGYGFGGHGDCPAVQAASGENVTVDSVTAFLERRLAWQGNDRLKVGEVSEQDGDTIIAEIVTKDGSLVDRLMFDRHSGRATRAE